MACKNIIDLSGITLDCNALSVGGIKKIFYTTIDNCVIDIDEDQSSLNYMSAKSVAFVDPTQVKEVLFNPKDGQTSYTDEKTVGPEGSESAVPTLNTFLPSMTAEKAALIDELANPYVKLVMFIETASGTKHILGLDFGMTLTSISGASGASRPDTNGYTLTFTGDEETLAYDCTDKWADVLTPKVPTP